MLELLNSYSGYKKLMSSSDVKEHENMTKKTLKQFISRLGVNPKDKIECSLCWE